MTSNFSNKTSTGRTAALIAVLLLTLCLRHGVEAAPTISDEESNEAAAAKQLLVEVNGRPLAGPFSTAEKRGGRIFLPAAAIGRMFGDVITTRPSAQIVSVRRHSGDLAELDLQTMQIRENGASILGFSDISGINIPQNPEELMLPLEWVSSLLGVSIHFHQRAGAAFHR